MEREGDKKELDYIENLFDDSVTSTSSYKSVEVSESEVNSINQKNQKSPLDERKLIFHKIKSGKMREFFKKTNSMESQIINPTEDVRLVQNITTGNVKEEFKINELYHAHFCDNFELSK